MSLVPVGAIGTANKTDVLEGETFSSKNAGTNATGTIPNNGNATITGPNDTLSENGYYSSISNSITDRGVLDINGPSDSGNAGYYDRIDNNITDRGSLSNVTPGDYEYAGYYDGGTVPGSEIEATTAYVRRPSYIGNSDGGGGDTFTISVDVNTEGSIIVCASAVASEGGDGYIVSDNSSNFSASSPDLTELSIDFSGEKGMSAETAFKASSTGTFEIDAYIYFPYNGVPGGAISMYVIEPQ